MKTNTDIYIEKNIRKNVNEIDTLACNIIEQIEFTDNKSDLTLLDQLHELQELITEWQENKNYI
tara:strand:- start:239 stop:430 length:192 start_codon:yes stop_codon:yes gene_type:complete